MSLACGLAHCDPQGSNRLMNFSEFVLKYRCALLESFGDVQGSPQSEFTRLVNVNGVGRTKRQLESFVAPRLLTIRAPGAETAFGNFRSIWPKFVIRKSVRLRINVAVSEDSIAVLAVQSPLSLRHR
jgi:hypothetical protein